MQSVISQSFDDFEYIVIDGGSTDGTAAIIEQYRDHLSYYHSRSDRGISDAFNKGLAQVSGKWVLFLNSDDYFHDANVLTRLSAVLKNNDDKDVIFGKVQRVSRDIEPVSLEQPIGHPFKWSEFLKKDTIPHPSSFTNMDFFRRVGGYDERYKIAIDYEFYLRGGKALNVLFHPEMVSCMREGGVSRAHRRLCLNECLRALEEHHACSPLFLLVYGNYLRFRLVIRGVLLKLHLVAE
ncbi:glycosyltransferase [Mariprofundus ferrooxydans]|nr:glycosyltransferase [Mariprofundus ferrooxydans]